MRNNYFKEIEENERKKQEEIERKLKEKKQKEIEELRKKKKNKINHKAEIADTQELDMVAILDLLDSSPGIYTVGGSLTEASLMLTAIQQ